MRIMRHDFRQPKSEKVARYTDITTHTAHGFMVNLANEEAARLGATVVINGGPLSGCSTATLQIGGKSVVGYSQEWCTSEGGWD